MYRGGNYESSTADAGRTTFPEKEAQKIKNDFEDIEGVYGMCCSCIDCIDRAGDHPGCRTFDIHV